MGLFKFHSKLFEFRVFLLLFGTRFLFGSRDVAQDLLPYLTDHGLNLVHFYFIVNFLRDGIDVPVVGFGLNGRNQLLSQTFQLLILVLVDSHDLLLEFLKLFFGVHFINLHLLQPAINFEGCALVLHFVLVSFLINSPGKIFKNVLINLQIEGGVDSLKLMLFYLFCKLVLNILLVDFPMEGLSYGLFTSLVIKLLLKFRQFLVHLLLKSSEIIIGNFIFPARLLVVEHVGGVVQFPLHLLQF